MSNLVRCANMANPDSRLEIEYPVEPGQEAKLDPRLAACQLFPHHDYEHFYDAVQRAFKMTTYSPIPAYLLGTACIGRGVMAILAPRDEYAHMGLSLEPAHAPVNHTTSTKPDSSFSTTSLGSVSPLMYIKGIREITFGLTLNVLQHQGQHVAVTLFASILCFTRLADGAVVWLRGGRELRYRAWGHWLTGVGMGVLVLGRTWPWAR